MANDMWLPAEAFDPQLDLATLAINLVAVGVYIACSAIQSVLRPLPHAIAMSDIRIQYAFGVALVTIFLFGVGMIQIGWLVWSPTRHDSLGRAMMRASHIVLVIVIALREHEGTSTSAIPDRQKTASWPKW